MKPTPPTVFRCTDLSVAAYCLMRGVALQKVEKNAPLSTFVFDPQGAVVEKEFYSGAEAVCRDYAAAMQAAKRALYAREPRR
jgi:hypothetical protein